MELFKIKGLPVSGLGVVTAILLLIPSVYWILNDNRVWPWDQALYGEITLDIFRAYGQGFVPGMEAMITAVSFKPPALMWVSQPFVFLELLTKRMEPALLFSILVAHGVLLVALYHIAVEAYGDSRGRILALAPVVFLASTPVFIGLSHQFFVEPLQTAIVALSYWLLAVSRRISRIRVLGHFVLLASLSLAVKTTTFLYNGLPLLLIFIYLLKDKREFLGRSYSWKEIGYLAFAMMIFLVTASWYWVNAEAMLEHVRNSALGSVALHYGSDSPFFTKVVFWAKSAVSALFVYPLLMWVFVLVLAAGVWKYFFGKRRQLHRLGNDEVNGHHRYLVPTAAAHVMLVVTVLSLQINEETRFLEPALPAVFIVLAYAMARLHGRLVPALFAMLSLLQWGAVHGQLVGQEFDIRTDFPWAVPLVADRKEYGMLSEVVDVTCKEDSKNRISIIGVEYSWLNHNSANFFSAKKALDSGYKCAYTSLGYAAADIERAVERFRSFMPKYFVSVYPSKMEPPNYLNKLSEPFFYLIKRSPSWEVIKTIGGRLVVFRSRADDTGLGSAE